MPKFLRKGLTLESASYDHLKGRIDVEMLMEDLGIDISFKVREHQYMCHCPNLDGLHLNGDANPSFGFNDSKLAWNCFVCGHGNVVELVQMMKPEYASRFKNDTVREEMAIQYLEQFADMTMSIDLAEKIQEILHPQKEEDSIMPEYPEDNLFKYRKIHPYLYERGLTTEVITEMQVGFDEEHLSIVIPHFFMGKLVGIQRRHLVEDPKGVYHCPICQEKKNKIPKYINTSNFPKINTLYGYDRMKQKMKEESGRSVIVVESPMTALKLMSMGFNRVVATFGQFNYEQASLVMAVPVVYFWPDNDKAGFSNAERSVNSMLTVTNLKIVPVVPSLKGDAAELNSAAEVSQYLQNAYPASLFKLHVIDNKLPTLQDILARNEH